MTLTINIYTVAIYLLVGFVVTSLVYKNTDIFDYKDRWNKSNSVRGEDLIIFLLVYSFWVIIIPLCILGNAFVNGLRGWLEKLRKKRK